MLDKGLASHLLREIEKDEYLLSAEMGEFVSREAAMIVGIKRRQNDIVKLLRLLCQNAGVS